MMKKLLLLGSAVFAFSLGSNAQKAKLEVKATNGAGHYEQAGSGLKTASTNTMLVVDTLHYFLNKYYFKTGLTAVGNYPYYKSSAATGTNVTHCGSRFDVPAGETVTVTGLEAYAGRKIPAANLNIPIHMMLCNLDGNEMPMLPPIDSVVALVNGTGIGGIGGNFVTARTMTTSFAVLFRNFSTTSGDTALLLRTASITETAAAYTSADKYADSENGKDYGFVRYNSVFYSTRDFTKAAGFGVGTQYEFMVAPRVTYELQSSQILPTSVVASGDTTGAVADTICTRTDLLFTNTSSPFFEHRQYNLNQFYRKWNLYSAFPANVAGAFASDSSITWHFEFYDVQQPARDSRVFLPYVNNHTITAVSGLSYYPLCFTANQFRTRLKLMGAQGKVPQLVYNQDFIVCLKYCNDDEVGISTLNNYENLNVYPNPAINGKTQISGLKGNNNIVVYNMMGQVIHTESTENSALEIDLTKQPKGTYVLKIMNTNGQTKVVKVLNQN